MGFLLRAFINEKQHFDKLSKQGQKFLLSLFLSNVTLPVFGIFVSAFIWRQSHDLMMVAYYNLSLFCMLPVGFYLNGQLLKKISVKRMFFAGALFRSLALALLIVTPHMTNLFIICFGMSLGFLSGIYWANRNLLNVKLTNTHNRIYFSSLDFISQTLSGIVVPLLIGAFIVFGTDYKLYTPVQGYYAVIFITILLTFLLISVIKNLHVKTPDVPNVIHRGACFQWNAARGLASLFGLMNGIFAFLPILLVLTYLGKEDTLGIVQSIAAIATGIVMYTIARSINNRYRVLMVTVSVGLSILSGLFLVLNFSALGIFTFIAFTSMAQQLLYTVAYSAVYDLADRENEQLIHDHRYAYVFDAELFLNVGRVAGILLFFLYIKLFSAGFALQFTALSFSVAQIAMIYLAKVVEEKKEAHALHAEFAPSPAGESNA